MQGNSVTEKVLKRLDIIVHLLLENSSEGSLSITAKIQRLSQFGLTTSEISDIVGKPSNYVSYVIK
jgi:hypothetical protein